MFTTQSTRQFLGRHRSRGFSVYKSLEPIQSSRLLFEFERSSQFSLRYQYCLQYNPASKPATCWSKPLAQLQLEAPVVLPSQAVLHGGKLTFQNEARCVSNRIAESRHWSRGSVLRRHFRQLSLSISLIRRGDHRAPAECCCVASSFCVSVSFRSVPSFAY
jgi:hypothetical protein